MCRACSSTVEITRSGATFRAIRHRPSRPSEPSAGSTSCPATSASNATAAAAGLVAARSRPVPVSAASTAFASLTSAETSACLGVRVGPVDPRLARLGVVVPGAHRRDHLAAAGHLPAHPADRRDQLGDGVLGGHRVVEDRGVHRPAPSTRQYPGRLDHLPDRVVDPVRALRLGDPLTPVHQAWTGRTPSSSSDSPHATFHRRSHRTASARLPVRQLVQRLQRQHRGHPGRRQRRAPDRGEQVRVTARRGTPRRGARPGTRTCCPPRPDARPPAPASHNSRSGPSTPCTQRSSQGHRKRSPAARHPPHRDFQRPPRRALKSDVVWVRRDRRWLWCPRLCPAGRVGDRRGAGSWMPGRGSDGVDSEGGGRWPRPGLFRWPGPRFGRCG